MKITFFRILSILILTISCLASGANAQYSVCCPASDGDCALPENQCNDYLEAASKQPSAENWIDRVSDALQNDDAQRRPDLPVKTTPDSATPIDFDLFSRGPCGGFSANAAVTENGAQQTDSTGKPHANRLIILREDCPAPAATPELDADASLLVQSLMKHFLTWSAVGRVHAQPAQANSYWDAVKDIDYSGNVSQSGTSTTLQVGNRVANKPEPSYSEYDLYDVEASYLYGCFGYESIYGFSSSENMAAVTEPQQNDAPELSINENIEPTAENQSTAIPQSSFVPFGAEFDGYLPYDVNEDQIDRDDPFEAASIEVIQKHAPLSETIGQKVEFEIGCPFEQKSSKVVGELPFTLEELTLLPRLLQQFADQLFRVFHRWDLVESGRQLNNRIEMALCGSESLTVWRDAIWAHQKSSEVTRELEIARLRREKMLSIAQTLDSIADQLKTAAANLVFLAERESHKLIGRRPSAALNR